MRTELIVLLLGVSLPASWGQGISSNPLSKITKQVAVLTDPLKAAPQEIKKQLNGNSEERTFTDYYFGGHKLATVRSDKDTGKVLNCLLMGDREFIAFMIGDKTANLSGPIAQLADELPYIPIINVTTALMDDYIEKCNGNDTSTDTRNIFSKVFSGLKDGPKTILKHAFIFPGTKWCGAGDVARDYDDLGPKAETDKCCRDHDNSIESMARGEEKYGLKNKLLYTMTKCPDDEQFNKCLYDTGSAHAGAVGTTYFNVLKTKCFDKRKKAKCVNKLLFALTPCTEYRYDENSPEVWQIFDPSPFVPNASIPAQKMNELLHAAPGFGDLISLF